MVWIGLRDVLQNGTFEWLQNGSSVASFNQWAVGKPSSSGGGKYCVVMKKAGASYYWYDIKCERKTHFVCQRGEEPSPDYRLF